MAEWAIAVMGAALQVLFDRAAHPEVLNFMRRKPDYLKEELLKHLQILLLSAKAVLGDAEEEKIIDPNVKEWIEKLEEAMDDAGKLLDEIVAKASESNSNSVSHTFVGQLKDYFNSVNSRLGKINERLTALVDLKNVIGFNEGKGKKESPLSLPTTGILDESEPVYGRDTDKKIIIQKLSSPNLKKARLSVFTIVGMAGVGKTTLSQLLLNDPTVQNIFKLRSWVHVSGRSDVFDLTKNIYESVTKSTTEIRYLDVLQDQLQKQLSKRKRFLLVLDDFWSENFDDWDLVKRPLTHGAPGSVIIVTTRNENVALTLRATVTHTLPLLKFEDCWMIFAHHAFGTKDANENETLKEIGKEIVKKCKGLPLSAKVLGRLLHSTDDALEWDNILNSKIWHLPADKSNILPSLRLSYHYLPLHLKRCFAFCSIFPKGCPVRKWILIFLWMAHDLLQSKDGKTMEKVGDEYFHELMSRSLLQQSMSNDSDFEMHDLMNDLAQHVGGDRFHRFEGGNLGDIPEKVHHLSFLQDKIDHPMKLGAFHDFSRLRTFLPFRLAHSQSPSSLTHGPLNFLEKNLTSLRVLSLSNFSITILPASSQNLQSLRYLNLSHTKIKQLPNFVVSLQNLLTLLLSSCDCLIQLPTSLPNLTNLRHLDLSGTHLIKMPPQFSRLNSLHMLTTFFVSEKNDASRVSELGALTQLCGTLSIVNLQDVSDATEASMANLKEKKFLKELKLRWTNNIHNSGQEKAVLDNLEPHKFLQKLTIERYGGIEFPQWLGLTSFSNMVSVYLIECRNCLSLPPLGQLCSLKTLRIAHMTRLKKVDSEFYGAHNRPFRSLKTLSFEDMLEWAEWVPGARFPSLQELHIQKCPKLIGNLNHQMPLLKKLEILECESLQFFPAGHFTLQLQALEHLHLGSSCNTLDSFPLCSFPALCYLHIEDCCSLQSLSISPEFQQDLGSLETLVLKNCLELKSFPCGGLRTPILNSLSINNCPLLVELCQRDTGVYWHLISHIPNIVIN